jgi:hypothetical protein
MHGNHHTQLERPAVDCSQKIESSSVHGIPCTPPSSKHKDVLSTLDKHQHPTSYLLQILAAMHRKNWAALPRRFFLTQNLKSIQSSH